MFLIALASFVAAVSAQGSVPCGVPIVQPNLAPTKRIVGGSSAVPGSWPWMAMITDDLDVVSGSGAIIHPSVVLTSAQHFKGPGYNVSSLNLKGWSIYTGSSNVSTTDPTETTNRINRVVVHPGYDITSLENDVALVFLTQPITWNNHTLPICIPDSSHTYQVGTQCWLPGWGSTSSTGNEETLNQLMYPILADSVCAMHWSDFLPKTEICAGYETSAKDFCDDDIGSPLVCQDTSSGAWYVQGIASSGGDCTVGDEPGIFEDVTVYFDWIKKTMADAGFPYQY